MSITDKEKKVEEELIKARDRYLALLEPIIREIDSEHDAFMKYLEELDVSEANVETEKSDRPRRNAAKNASSKISSQAHALNITKLRRPDDRDGNIYDIGIENKLQNYPKCSTTKDSSILLVAEPKEDEGHAIVLSDDEKAPTPIKKKGRPRQPRGRRIKTEKLSIVSIKEEKVDANNQTYLKENPCIENSTEAEEINQQSKEAPDESQFIPPKENQEIDASKDSVKNDSGVSVYQDAITTQLIPAESVQEELLNLDPPHENVKVKRSIKEDKKLSDRVEVLIEKDSAEPSKQGFSEASEKPEILQECSPEDVQEVSNDATFVMALNPDVVKTIKEEMQTPERRVVNNLNQTVVVENLMTPPPVISAAAIWRKSVSLISDDLSPEIKSPPKKTNKKNTEEPRSQVKLRVNALEKVIAEQQTPGVRITRTKSRLNKNKENIDQQLNSGQKLNGVPAKSQLPKLANTKLPSASKLTALTAKKFNSSKNCTPHVIRTARTVMKSTQKNVSTEKDDSLKKQREEEARKKKEQMLLEKLEEKRRKRLEKERLAQQSREQQEKEKLEKLAKDKERKEKLIQEREEKIREEQQAKKLLLLQKAQEVENRRKAEEKLRLLKMKQELEEQRIIELKQKEAEERARLEEEKAQKNKKQAQAKPNNQTYVQQHLEESILDYSLPPAAMANGFENLQSDYSTDEDDKPPKNNKARPDWCKSEARQVAVIKQARTSTKLVDKLFNVKATTPNLRIIFPGIAKEKLMRRSSAVWKTPPRYSTLPRFQ